MVCHWLHRWWQIEKRPFFRRTLATAFALAGAAGTVLVCLVKPGFRRSALVMVFVGIAIAIYVLVAVRERVASEKPVQGPTWSIPPSCPAQVSSERETDNAKTRV